jgi:hypothetical protein
VDWPELVFFFNPLPASIASLQARQNCIIGIGEITESGARVTAAQSARYVGESIGHTSGLRFGAGLMCIESSPSTGSRSYRSPSSRRHALLLLLVRPQQEDAFMRNEQEQDGRPRFVVGAKRPADRQSLADDCFFFLDLLKRLCGEWSEWRVSGRKPWQAGVQRRGGSRCPPPFVGCRLSGCGCGAIDDTQQQNTKQQQNRERARSAATASPGPLALHIHTYEALCMGSCVLQCSCTRP